MATHYTRLRPGLFKYCVLAAAFCFLLAGGCATRQSGGPQVNTPSLIVPEDDGASPLTSTEMAALKTTGQIDKNLPADALSDVARQYKYFLRKGRNTMSVFSKRAEQYLAYSRKVFRSRGMPEELAYLAIVESGYKADAKSPARAARGLAIHALYRHEVRSEPGLVDG